MPQPPDAYSATEDLLIGDIPLPMRHGDGSAAVTSAAEDIDSQLGHLYSTPIQVENDPVHRPTVLFLKKVNNLIASGRLILDMAAGGEDVELHQYGKSLLEEGLALLARLVSREIVLTGVAAAEDNGTKPFTKAAIFNEDEESLVEGFYRNAGGNRLVGVPSLPYSRDEIA